MSAATDPRRTLRQRLDTPLVRNVIALYGLNAAGYLFPVVTSPYLARVLHPDGWGRVAVAQSLGQSLSVIVEYGFTLSATRAVARAAGARRGELFTAVLGAKLLLAIATMALAAVAMPWLAGLGDRRLLWAAVLWAVATGFHPLWYYQGREHVQPILLVDLAGNLIAIAAVFAFCRTPDDAWKVLAIEAGAATLMAVLGSALLLRELTPAPPRWAHVREPLVTGGQLFLYRLALTFYSAGNPLLLGMLASPATVGYFAAGEKIAKTLFVAAIYPLNQALYPYFSRLIEEGRGHATRSVGGAIIGFAIAGAAASAALLVAAPLVIRLVFGPDFAPAVPALRILALLLPVLSTSTAIVMHRLLTASRDRVLLAITVAAGIVNVGLAVALAPRFGAPGMAASVVGAELVVLFCVRQATRTAV